MKAAKVPQITAKAARRRKAGTNTTAVIPPEGRRSTGAALLKHAPGWAGDDLEEVLQIVTGTRAKTRF